LLAFAITGCGGDDPSQHEHAESREEIQEKAQVMRGSDEFVIARDAMHRCLEELGYQNVGGSGVILLDGSSIPTGSIIYVRGAYLDYQIHRDQCAEQSGFNDVVAQYGLADPTPDPGKIRAQNERSVAQMNCLATKGYSVPEPKTLRGFLHFDLPRRSPEEEAAYLSDITECNREIWGTDFPPAY
jgi:hypothetical protein